MDRRNFSLSFAGFSLASTALIPVHAATSLQKKRPGPTGVSTFTQVGKEKQLFLEHREAVLAEKSGSGYIDHMWFGGAFPHYSRLRLRIYVDDESVPSIDMEIGLGAGVGFEDPYAPWGTKFSGITGNPSGIFMNYPVPFAKSMRVTAELPAGAPRDSVFWWIVRGIENMPLEVCGIQMPAHARLRLHKNEDLQVQPLDEFSLCKVEGAGMVFMVTMAARSANFEFMEAQMRAYFGSDGAPQFLSSGLEDYFLGTYYFNRGLYHLRQAGLTHRNDEDHSFSAYRFHDLDPILYSDGLRLACRCGEKSGDKVFGETGNPQTTTYTTYTWTYQW